VAERIAMTGAPTQVFLADRERALRTRNVQEAQQRDATGRPHQNKWKEQT
jgi:hypothetical protein